MEAIPKSDIKSVIKSDNRFDISIKRTTWIGHIRGSILLTQGLLTSTSSHDILPFTIAF